MSNHSKSHRCVYVACPHDADELKEDGKHMCALCSRTARATTISLRIKPEQIAFAKNCSPYICKNCNKKMEKSHKIVDAVAKALKEAAEDIAAGKTEPTDADQSEPLANPSKYFEQKYCMCYNCHAGGFVDTHQSSTCTLPCAACQRPECFIGCSKCTKQTLNKEMFREAEAKQRKKSKEARKERAQLILDASETPTHPQHQVTRRIMSTMPADKVAKLQRIQKKRRATEALKPSDKSDKPAVRRPGRRSLLARPPASKDDGASTPSAHSNEVDVT